VSALLALTAIFMCIWFLHVSQEARSLDTTFILAEPTLALRRPVVAQAGRTQCWAQTGP